MRRLSFSAEMVRARNEGRKTMTRRIVKPQPIGFSEARAWHDIVTRVCPYGQPGDLLAETEEWAVPRRYDDRSTAGLHFGRFPSVWLPFVWRVGDGDKPLWAGRTRLARHMLAALARRALPLVAVRAERLHQITEADARLEGVESVAEFSDLWEGIHGAFSWGRNPWVWVLTLSPVTEVEA